MVHEIARRGFAREADAYERSRPGYPPSVVDWLSEHLGLRAGRVVVDLAAGTGKLTRLLLPTAATVVAVEPLAAMVDRLRAAVPGVAVVAGTAEALPLRSGSADAVTIAQAFHWFDADAALGELARVLRPGGRVGMVWNARDRSVEWVDRAWAIIDGVEGTAPWRDHDQAGRAHVTTHPAFGPVSTAVFHHEQRCTPDEVVDRFRSVSHVAALGPQRQAEVLGAVRALLETHPDTRGRPTLRVAYRVDCYWMERAGP